MTNEEKRQAVLALLAKWSDWSDREIARRAKVSPPFVGMMRVRAGIKPADGNRLALRNGTPYTVNTAPISKRNRRR
jgi:hypothetical protein